MSTKKGRKVNLQGNDQDTQYNIPLYFIETIFDGYDCGSSHRNVIQEFCVEDNER